MIGSTIKTDTGTIKGGYEYTIMDKVRISKKVNPSGLWQKDTVIQVDAYLCKPTDAGNRVKVIEPNEIDEIVRYMNG